MNKHAPLKRKRVLLKLESPWYRTTGKPSRSVTGWRDSGDAPGCTSTGRCCGHSVTWSLTWSDLPNASTTQTVCISACGQDQKQLFWIVGGLLKTKDISALPKHISNQELADPFNEYFVNKIVNIRNTTGTATAVEEAPLTDGRCSLDQFTSTSELELAKVLGKMSTTTCRGGSRIWGRGRRPCQGA